MRIAVVVLAAILCTSAVARADEGRRPGAAFREGGIICTVLGVMAGIAGTVLVARGAGWELGNGLGEHYDPTPDWVSMSENAGWGLIGGSQALVAGGIVLLSHGDTLRDRARRGVGVSLAPTRDGAAAVFTARF